MVRRARTHVATETLSAADARALAIHAQGLGAARTSPTSAADLAALVSRLGAVQIDSVNVLVRSHYLPPFSRLGTYDARTFDALSYAAPRALFEYWGHEASLLPVAHWPLWQWRMAQAHRWKGVAAFARKKQFVAEVMAIVRDRGPVPASEIDLGKRRPKSGWWEWSDAKKAVEYLFWSGQVTAAGRRGFERLYDLPSRVIPADILAAPAPAPLDAQAALVEHAARALGVATLADLRDYFHLTGDVAQTAVPRLVDAGALLPVAVEGWAQPAFRHRDAQLAPIDTTRAALLSPFDSLLWFRERTERLFGVRIRLEIYTPAHKRIHGYYVLPLLVGDRIVARVDLKSDRAAGVLRVQAAHVEPGIAPKPAAAALRDELARMADWLGLARVEATGAGNLASALMAATKPKKYGKRSDLGAPIDAFIEAKPPAQREILVALRDLVLAVAPDATSELKWGMPFFQVGGEMLCAFRATKGYIALILHGPPDAFKDPDGLLEGEAKGGRHLKIATLAELPRAKVTAWLETARKRTKQ